MTKGYFGVGNVTLYVRSSNTYHVEAVNKGKIVGVVSLIDYAAGVLGIKGTKILEPGTRVILLAVDNSFYIIATIPITERI